jgi:hypothetical protein
MVVAAMPLAGYGETTESAAANQSELTKLAGQTGADVRDAAKTLGQKSKADADKVKKAEAKSTFPLVVVRPNHYYSDGDNLMIADVNIGGGLALEDSKLQKMLDLNGSLIDSYLTNNGEGGGGSPFEGGGQSEGFLAGVKGSLGTVDGLPVYHVKVDATAGGEFVLGGYLAIAADQYENFQDQLVSVGWAPGATIRIGETDYILFQGRLGAGWLSGSVNRPGVGGIGEQQAGQNVEAMLPNQGRNLDEIGFKTLVKVGAFVIDVELSHAGSHQDVDQRLSIRSADGSAPAFDGSIDEISASVLVPVGALVPGDAIKADFDQKIFKADGSVANVTRAGLFYEIRP